MKSNLINEISEYIISNYDKVKINSKDIEKNDIFIALKGTKIDGNKFIKDAFKAGAKYCITNKINREIGFNSRVLFHKDIFSFLKIISLKKRSLYSGIVIGITGSAGKTTLKENLKFFLSEKYKVSASIKSYNNKLGVMLSILNMDINSKFSIFEIGTNNFYEIRELTNLVKPSQMFITNILPTHLENFKIIKNIALEKSDIFNKKFNSQAKTLYLQMNSNDEKIIKNIAKKQKIKNIITIGNDKLDCYVAKISKYKSYHKIKLNILKHNFNILLKKYEDIQIKNLIFVLAFFIFNKINTNLVFKKKLKFPEIEGRGSLHKIILNGVNINLIDQSYNANPDTMIESIKNFSKNNTKGFKKILILGNMNELGLNEVDFHCNVLREIKEHKFDMVILSGDSFKKALKKFSDFKIKYTYRKSRHGIMNYINKNVHKKAMMMVKCSNSTEVNKFVKLLKLKMKDKIV